MVVLQRTKKTCTKNYTCIAHAQPLLRSLNFLFSDILLPLPLPLYKCNFLKLARSLQNNKGKYIIMNNSFHLERKHVCIFVSTLSVARSEQSSKREKLGKTASSEEQIVSKDKYLSMSSHQIEAYCVYYPSNILQLIQFWKVGNITQIFLSFSWGIFSHMTGLDQSRMSNNICCIMRW